MRKSVYVPSNPVRQARLVLSNRQTPKYTEQGSAPLNTGQNAKVEQKVFKKKCFKLKAARKKAPHVVDKFRAVFRAINRLFVEKQRQQRAGRRAFSRFFLLFAHQIFLLQV
jgi:hypothetical protein